MPPSPTTEARPGRGTLRVYLGGAPGVGKTFAMLNEGSRRVERGARVLVGIVETHARARTAEQLRGLEVAPRRTVEHRGTVLEEMDVDAILARRPRVCLVDELAHTNAPGSRNEKRWQDVDELLDAGIDVVSTLNIQHLDSLSDVVERITGVRPRETIPDVVVRRADQIELVDMTPEALRRRMAHGNIYPPERVDAALGHYFRPGNLGALRELALLWVADRVEESLHDYLEQQGITDSWETRERVVVALTGSPTGDALIRRAARMAARSRGELIGVHVATGDGLAGGRTNELDRQRRLLAELGGTYHEVVGTDAVSALLAFARREKGTQLVIGATRRSRWHDLVHGSVAARVTRGAGQLDVHVIAAPEESFTPPRPTAPRSRASLSRARVVAAWVLTGVGLPLLTAVLAAARDSFALPSVLLLFLSLVIAIAAIGGRLVSVVAAVAASQLVNWFFVEPFHTLTIDDSENLLALLVFVVVAVTVGSLVDLTARRAHEAMRARREAAALVRTAATLAADPDPLPRLVENVVETFDLEGAAVLAERDGEWLVVTAAGEHVPQVPGDGTVFALDDGGRPEHHLLVVRGAPLSVGDLEVFRALTDQLSTALEARRLSMEAAEADALADIDTVRTALLQAVSHDLRTPLATIKAMVSGLRSRDVAWSAPEIAEALDAVDEETDRLNAVVGNLLDASRLQSGALAVDARPTAIDEPVAGALASIDAPSGEVEIALADDLPLVVTDPVLLERAIANLVSNALRHNPSGSVVRIDAGVVEEHLHVRIVDRGPGIPSRDRAHVLAPFQRLGDAHDGGVGLGMAIANGFITAMRGTLTLDDTPGGGLTATIALPIAQTEPTSA